MLAFALPHASFPLQAADTEIDYESLKEWNPSSGAGEGDLTARGTVQGLAVPFEKRGGSLLGSNDVLFETAVEISAVTHYEMQMNKYGGRTRARTEIAQQLNGQTQTREIPILSRYGKEGMVAGRIRFVKPVSAQELKAPGSTDGVEVVLRSDFEAGEGDFVVAAGRVGTFMLSAHTLD